MDEQAKAILIVDDHRGTREALSALLHKENDVGVIAEAGDGLTALRLVRELSPDVVLMDVAMPGMDGIETTRQIAAAHPAMRIVAVSVHSEAQMFREMFRAGARGYVLKERVYEELIRAIRAVLSDQVYVGSGVLA